MNNGDPKDPGNWRDGEPAHQHSELAMSTGYICPCCGSSLPTTPNVAPVAMPDNRALAEISSQNIDSDIARVVDEEFFNLADGAPASTPAPVAIEPAYRDAVTREQIQAWAKLANIHPLYEKHLEQLGDFAIFARKDRAAPPTRPDVGEARDAARYRWLRKQSLTIDRMRVTPVRSDKLDKMIDDALLASTPTPQGKEPV